MLTDDWIDFIEKLAQDGREISRADILELVKEAKEYRQIKKLNSCEDCNRPYVLYSCMCE